MRPDVIIVEAPFLSTVRPALGASALSAALARQGVRAEIDYINMRYAEAMGIDFCEYIAERSQTNLLIGEWIFSQDVAGAVWDETYMAWIRSYLSPGHFEQVRAARAAAPAFARAMAERLVATEAPVIGFSSTFQQNCASLSIARRIKQLRPETVICFGGANCDGPMGVALADSFSWIDYVFQGEADLTFPAFMTAFLDGETPATVAGQVYRAAAPAAPETPSADLIVDMDQLPVPDFSDYFATLDDMAYRDRVAPGILFESSRGCWWGAKHHCTFCGLNGVSMTYRTKSAERVLEEIDTHHRRWNVSRFEAADNIMNMRHVSGVFDVLAERGAEHEFFYEIKSNMKPDHLYRIARGGVTWVQAGVESLDDEVLAKMEKGVTGLQNIRMLRSCAEIGIRALWNLLCGFPGETAEQYADMAAMMPLLEHLDPPTGYCNIRLDRFSPYYERAAELGFENVRPARAYAPVYRLPESRLAELAYFFEGDPAGIPRHDYLKPVAKAIPLWREKHIGQSRLPDLSLVQIGPMWLIKDSRSCAIEPFHILSEDEKAVLDAFREPGQIRVVLTALADADLAEAPSQVLDRLIGLKYIVTDRKGFALTLVLYPDFRVHGIEKATTFPGGWVKDPEPAPNDVTEPAE